MPFTTHGYKVPGLPSEGEWEGSLVKCGGPGLCVKCSHESADILRKAIFGTKKEEADA